MKKALIIIDMQNDFLPGGSLAIPGADQLLPLIDQLMTLPFDLCIASRDWHPPLHCSFAVTHPGKKIGEHLQIEGIDQMLWPVHCVQHTPGAEFAQGWSAEKVDAVFSKGTRPTFDSYSTFFDNGHVMCTELDAFLKKQAITTLYFAGLATEYCVKYSVLDALALGFEVFVIKDACKGLEAHEIERALEEMKKAGALITSSKSLNF